MTRARLRLPRRPGPCRSPKSSSPVFTAAELEAARAEARQAGRTEAEHGLTASRNRLLALLADGMLPKPAGGAYAAAEAAAEGVARSACWARWRMPAGSCASSHGAARIARAGSDPCCPALSRGAAHHRSASTRTWSAVVDAGRGRVVLDVEIAERVHVLPTDAMPPGDARITWADGSAVRDTGASAGWRSWRTGGALGLLQREICVDA